MEAVEKIVSEETAVKFINSEIVNSIAITTRSGRSRIKVISNKYVYCRPATHPDLIGISRFFSTNLGVSRFPDSTCENPEFLFRFKIGKTKGRLTLLYGPCLQIHKVRAKNKCYDRLNPLHTATQRVK